MSRVTTGTAGRRPTSAGIGAGRSKRRRTGTVSATVLAFLFGLIPAVLAPVAVAGEYEVRSCGGSASAYLDGKFERYGDGRIDVTETCRTQFGGSITISQKNHGGVVPDGYGGGYRWHAPPEASVIGTGIRARLHNANGIAAQIYAINSNGGYLRLDGGTPHDGKVRDMEGSFPGKPRSQVVARLACLTKPPCRNRPADPKAYIQVRRIALRLRDSTAPSVSAGGSLFNGPSTIAGKVGYSAGASDSGGGVWKLFAVINGHEVELANVKCPGDRGGYADRMRPCPSSTSRTGTLNTSKTPFRQGSNTVRLCARDYANGHVGTPTGPNTGCGPTRTVTVDNEGPPSPPGLRTVGGSDWRAINDFGVAWDSPSDLTTPVVAAHYTVVDSDNRTVAEDTLSGSGITEIDSISVPEIGSFTVRVRLRDQAGNTGPAGTTSIRFDDRRPAAPDQLTAKEWLSAADFPARFEIAPSEPGGPSGIAGYAVAVGDSDDIEPCPEGRCAPGELTVDGSSDDRVFVLDRLGQGRHWLRVVAVSGAGLPSKPSPPTPVNVDLTDPVTAASGIPTEWSRRPVTVTVTARDRESGMRPGPDSKAVQPYTAVSVGGGEPVMRIGDSVAVTISADGSHEVRHWARDLAGNSNSGARLENGHRHDEPGSEAVRVDTSPPIVEFTNGLDRDRPDRIWVRAYDLHSGVMSGRIEFRPAGTDEEFRPLATSHRDPWLVATFPSNSVADGMYELRAVAVDRAGNGSITTQRQDGSAMVLRNPVLPRPRIGASWHGNSRLRIAPQPGRPAFLVGRLRDHAGRVIGRTPVEIVERFARGSRRKFRSTTVATDRSGRFRARLRPGPTRAVTARFAGSDELARTESRPLRLIGLGAVRLGLAPRIALNHQAIRMRGSIRSHNAMIPGAGKLVAIQYLDPDRGRWRPVEVIRTDRRGRFNYAYSFRTIAFAQRIIFRAVSLPEAGWPYLPAVSGPSPVVVYPR